ncbi:HWE histidine kinase domain-containing protein [Novosphingobium sp. KCTC 2891]|uniref:HWE histidine kinase domain-containing protein n=1 Tax=Novosphingobium sp. KCTC 2891 TaxID=2989730 RepID=UPI0022232F68|nr:HWE histidine kinase domain-containing protein [Novosphingobium sp. KCTC 2891]
MSIRWLIDRGAYGFPFITFSPVILLAAIFLDWRHAILTAMLAAVAVEVFFVRAAIAGTGFVFFALYALTIAILVLAGEMLRQVVIENENRATEAEAFNIELQHRAKNALQMMRALASRASQATDPAEFYALLSGRLDALARSNELLRFGALPSCEVRELVDAALRPFRSGQIIIEGQPCHVHKNAVTPLMMALHELATNATKYGALSVDGGQVALAWRPVPTGTVRFEWQERGGPPVRPPARRGIGARLLQAHGALEQVDLAYDRDGVRCRLEATAA